MLERTITLAQRFQDLEVSQPIKVIYAIQVLEAKTLKTLFPKPEMHEPLRLATQKLSMAERKSKLVGLIDPAHSFKKSGFDNNGPEEVKRVIQVRFYLNKSKPNDKLTFFRTISIPFTVKSPTKHGKMALVTWSTTTSTKK